LLLKAFQLPPYVQLRKRRKFILITMQPPLDQSIRLFLSQWASFEMFGSDPPECGF
jgi:hypothetical protein